MNPGKVMMVWPSPFGSARSSGPSIAVLLISSSTRENSIMLCRKRGGRESGVNR